MDRRSILKTAGLALATSALFPLRSLANSQIEELNSEENNKPLAPGKRKLGKLEVSSIGIGVQNMSRNYQTTIPSRPEMHRIIRSAYDNGVTLFDAAEAYGPFEVEKILGEGVASFRDKIVISTKFGWNIDQETGKRLPGLNSRPEHIKIVVEGMLKRLKTDRIDLLYQHRVDPQVPIEDVVGAIQSLIKEGKLLHYGLSEPGQETVRRAHAIHPITAIQNEYSLLWRGPEKTIIPLCEQLGIGFVSWSPLGVGFLTGAIDEGTRFAQGDIRGIESRFSPDNLPANMALVELIQKWSNEKQAAPAQISLAWLLAQKPWIVPIPGTTQMAHMLENTRTSQIKFSANELQEFNAALNGIKILGERLPAGVLAFSDVEAPEKKK
ncbi:aldo/keto reductase [Flavobacterium aquidurense]|uniref:Putative oxidoreductase, aryl-alcohol dehydrogenase like protein n=1 Tax=Flavobacterium aquidurense TaxID=362413 RepID=A0A0Q1BNT4_9FLAO|nr:aldo/keto reductase [Flavobacterium aquidurense]KQB42536.1 putative oxidoreductase, aryl-alcohol dehydrogenase like protein [Flavobacterium aquidurense]